jgi:adiponectin receptor
LGGFLLFLALAVAGGGREAVHEVAPGIMRYATHHATSLFLFFSYAFFME